MEDRMIAVEETMKIEVGEVKLQTAEMDSGSFGVEQIIWGPTNSDEIALNRIKNEPNFVEALSNEEVLEINGEIIKLEKDMDYETSEVSQIREELIIKKDSSFGADTEIVLNSALKLKLSRRRHHVLCKKASKKSYSCYNCNYTAHFKYLLINHMKQHKNRKSPYLHSSKLSTCVHCNAIFKSKRYLDDHTIQKHPEFIASVSSKIRQCTYCAFKTAIKSTLDKHMPKHDELVDSYKPKSGCKLKCIHCDKAYITKIGLNDHTVKEHPDFIESVSNKIHECKYCPYKTTNKSNLERHMLKHPGTVNRFKMSCIHCDKTFKSKQCIDEHTIREHPDFIGSVSSKIHECTHCPYKTTNKSNLERHMLKYPGTVDRFKMSCIHCDKTFKSKQCIDEHTIREHPDFIKSVSTRIHECKYCAYKTTKKPSLDRHMLKHPEIVDRSKMSCIHCDKTFNSKQCIDEHTIREHPDFIESVSTKIHECKHCAYKTTKKPSLDRHMLKHPEAADRCNMRQCIHCNKTFIRKRNLDGHTIRKHPDFIASVSSKIHECTHCTYKTTLKSHFDRHKLKHSKTSDSYTFRCIHCDKTYRTKMGLDNHTIRKHTQFIASISGKIHECSHCAYKTTTKHSLETHMLKHPETADRFIMSMCIHCNKTFTCKRSLDGHTISKHPDFISSVSAKIHHCPYCTYKTIKKPSLDDHTIKKHPDQISSKIHECIYCAYKTTRMTVFARHMLKHSEAADRFKMKTCIHCNKTFASKRDLDGHTIRKHPDHIASISSKIYECTYCAYKTITKIILDEHTIRKHPDFVASISSKIHKCTHCTYITALKGHFDSHKLIHS